MERAMEQLNRLTRSLRRARTVELPEGEAPRGRALHFAGRAAVGDRGRAAAWAGRGVSLELGPTPPAPGRGAVARLRRARLGTRPRFLKLQMR